jgi:hypothetical protein
MSRAVIIVLIVVLAGSIFGIVTNGLSGLVTFFLIGAAGGVVGAVMWFGREPEHNEHVGDQPHS